jgi:hypothetical protein
MDCCTVKTNDITYSTPLSCIILLPDMLKINKRHIWLKSVCGLFNGAFNVKTVQC